MLVMDVGIQVLSLDRGYNIMSSISTACTQGILSQWKQCALKKTVVYTPARLDRTFKTIPRAKTGKIAGRCSMVHEQVCLTMRHARAVGIHHHQQSKSELFSSIPATYCSLAL